MLTTQSVALIIFIGLPLLALFIALVIRPTGRRLLGALVGGVAYAASHISWDTLASYAGWWRFPTGPHAPLYFYIGSFIWGICTALIGWRVQRRFGLVGVALYVLGMGVLGAANDYVGMAVLNTTSLITFAPGIVPFLADILCSGTNALAAQLGMRPVAGPATADHLAGFRLRAPLG